MITIFIAKLLLVPVDPLVKNLSDQLLKVVGASGPFSKEFIRPAFKSKHDILF